MYIHSIRKRLGGQDGGIQLLLSYILLVSQQISIATDDWHFDTVHEKCSIRWMLQLHILKTFTIHSLPIWMNIKKLFYQYIF